MAINKKVGVVIGRFQLPQLHGGHKAFITHVLEANNEACVFVGVKDTPDLKNPLPYPAVKAMIAGEFRTFSHKLQIHPLKDVETDLQWSEQIDQFLALLYPNADITLYSGRDGFKPYYKGRYVPVKDWLGYDGNVNGTDVRDAIIQGDASNNEEFRKGIIYGVGRVLQTKA
jgi:nicotinamide mononucleotide adenylyltransferase